MTHLRCFLCACLMAFSFVLAAQSVQGVIRNEFGEPVPFANVYVRQTGIGTVTDDTGHYGLNFRIDGEYEITFSSLGYTSQTVTLFLGLEEQTYDVRLLTSGVELQEVTVSASGRDKAYGIIKKAIAGKEAHLRAIGSFQSDVYVKAVEEVEDLVPEEAKSFEIGALPASSPFETSTPPIGEELLAKLNMVEMKLRLSYAYPGSYKEERTAYAAYGNTKGLFLPVYAETDFNFYRNLIALPGISLSSVISPLSPTSVLTYAFKLLETNVEEGRLVYRIRVTPTQGR